MNAGLTALPFMTLVVLLRLGKRFARPRKIPAEHLVEVPTRVLGRPRRQGAVVLLAPLVIQWREVGVALQGLAQVVDAVVWPGRHAAGQQNSL